MKKSKKIVPFALAAVLAATPFMTVPKAFAVSNVNIEAYDDETDTDSKYTITFELEKKLSKGGIIEIKFPSGYSIDKSIRKSDVEVNGDTPSSVDVTTRTISIKTSKSLDKGDDVEVVISSGITNPKSEDSYKIVVSTDNESSDYGYIDISDSGGSKSSNKDFSVSLSSKYTGDDSKYELGSISLKSKSKLERNEYIYVTFPTNDMLPRSLDTRDVLVNGYEAADVSITGKSEVKIKVPSKADGDKKLKITFDKNSGVTNPGDEGTKYTFKVRYDSTTYTSEKFEIKKGSGSSSSSSSSSGSSFNVSLTDSNAGSRSGYQFELDLGKEKLYSNDSIDVEFPSADMIPGILRASDITINGTNASVATSYNNHIYLKTGYDFKTSSTVKVNFTYDAFLTNPATPGSDYQLSAKVAGKTFKSNKFSITGVGGVVPPTTPTTPIPPATPGTTVNNSTATVTLTKSTLNTVTGMNINIVGLNAALIQNRDYFEIILPAGFRSPTFMNVAAVKVNGIQPSFVTARGQNLVIYPTQAIPAATPVNISIAESGGLATPNAVNVYSIGVYTSAERNMLFGRPVSIGGAKLPATTPTPPAATPPTSAIPAGAASLKVGTASFVVNGKTYPLSAAPYTLNGNTLVPAQFFKEALALTTQWNNTSVSITSGTKQLKFTVGSTAAKAGTTNATLPVAVQIKNGMPMLPIKFVTDQLGYKLTWDANSSSIIVAK